MRKKNPTSVMMSTHCQVSGNKKKKSEEILPRLNVCHDVFYFFAEIIGNLFLAVILPLFLVCLFLQSWDLSQLDEILFEIAISLQNIYEKCICKKDIFHEKLLKIHVRHQKIISSYLQTSDRRVYFRPTSCANPLFFFLSNPRLI